MSHCAFCSIVAEGSSAYRLYENDHSLGFLDIEPATRGHTLVIPMSHYETLTDIPTSLAGDVFQTIPRVASALESAYQLEGYNIVQSNGVSAGQDVFHAHIHVIPRYEEDTLALEWSGEGSDETRQQEIATKIRDELSPQP